MQNQDRENPAEEINAESAQGEQIREGDLNFVQGAEPGGEEFGVDPPIIIDGGGQA
ncbi:MAG: hypothetical protein ACJ741_04135 [Pyrinomonadaceae bacterium]